MEAHSGTIEPVTLTDILALSTWNRERTSDELRNFVNSRHAALPDDTEIE